MKLAAGLLGLMVMRTLLAAAAGEERLLKMEFDSLTARATALMQVVRHVEENAERQGHSLHPDLVEARVLVESAMDDAEDALRAQDWGELRELIIRARGCVERLRRKL